MQTISLLTSALMFLKSASIFDALGTLSSNLHFPLLLAQMNTASIDVPVRAFLDFVQKLLVLPALGLVVWASWLFHDAKIREAVLALVGAFLCTVAVPIVKAFFGY